MVRFIDDTTVLINWYFKDYKEFLQGLTKSFLNHKINIEVVDLKATRMTKTNWAYINFLQTEDRIIVPAFSEPEDEHALQQIHKYFPSYHQDEIMPINASEIVKLHGAFNCTSWR